MAHDYSLYYNKYFLPIMNIVDIDDEKKITSLSTDVVNICYFGGLHLGRDVELCRFAKYLRENISCGTMRWFNW